MAKPNVNTASRDELIGTGVRAEIVDEIMKQRQRRDGVSLEMLAELSGVGPAALESLGDRLDFGWTGSIAPVRKPKQRRKSDQPPQLPAQQAIDVAETALEAGTEQAAELVAAAAQGHAEVATGASPVVRAAIEAGGLATAREASSTMPEATPTAATTEQQRSQVVALTVGVRSSFARMLAEVLREQGEENTETMAALGQAQHVHDVIRLQGDYLRHTLERMANLNRRWLELASKTGPPDLPD